MSEVKESLPVYGETTKSGVTMSETSEKNPLLPPEGVSAETGDLREEIIDALCRIFDPEIPVNIWELGLIYNVDIDEDNKVDIKMTLTTPACPVAGSLPPDVERTVRGVKGVKDVTLELVWDPPWTKEMMSEAAKLTLGFL